jgi:hypothetical protein
MQRCAKGILLRGSPASWRGGSLVEENVMEKRSAIGTTVFMRLMREQKCRPCGTIKYFVPYFKLVTRRD